MTLQRAACYNFAARHIVKSRSPRGRASFAVLLNTSALYRINSKFARPYLKFWNNAQNMVIFYGQAIERERKTEGPVLVMSQKEFRNKLNRLCAANGLPEVGVHGLRHSSASLAYRLQIPEQITTQIGGWAGAGTMRKIYTHIAQADINHYSGAMSQFYKNANKMLTDY